MTDLHTHILPGMDDGAENAACSIRMLKIEKQQGVHTVALTPHFYPERESVSGFLSRRKDSYDALHFQISFLSESERENIPVMVQGAEVAWIPEIADLRQLEKLCYEGTNYLLLELPISPWSNRVFDSLNDFLNRTGLIPVIAHIDRYFGIQNNKQLEQLFEFGLPTQISAAAFSHPVLRWKARRFIESGAVQLLISDCHNTKKRPPNLLPAYQWVEKKLGNDIAMILSAHSDDLLSLI